MKMMMLIAVAALTGWGYPPLMPLRNLLLVILALQLLSRLPGAISDFLRPQRHL